MWEENQKQEKSLDKLIEYLKNINEVSFNELVRLLEKNGFNIVKEKGSIRYYGKAGCNNLVRLDFHGSKEVPTGTCSSILKSAGIRIGGRQW
ncbi:MAG: type II toxin-antitoxin system HicA family toxin [Candidatus Magnetoovum sp. WYHC-5]|nr:type II toxin-antitoxin system HicA family toxin [Candidatus Magnetoovum sp. WYHC-5]